MKNRIFSIITSLIVLSIGIHVSCKQLGLESEETDNSALVALAALAGGSSSTTSASTICAGGASTGTSINLSTATLSGGCVNGVTTSMDSALPDWIKNNFSCSVAFVVGDYICFKSKNLPNTNSYYYTQYSGMTQSTSYSLYEALPSGNTKAGTNVVISQNLVYAIPLNPTIGSGTVSTQGGLVSIGITRNGLAIFNNAAAPPDVLADEATTFDNYQGHPQNSGVYHHHAGVPKVCNNTSAPNDNSGACSGYALIGIALDGFAIYGQKCNSGGSDFTPTLDSLHGHTGITTHFSTATYHYHYANDPTATIYTLMGSYFRGNKGSVSN